MNEGAFLDAQKKPPYDWDLTLGAWAGTLEPYWMHQIWSEEFIPELNHVNYINKEVETLFEESATECDDLPRIYGEIQRILAEDSPYIFLFQNESYAAIEQPREGHPPDSTGHRLQHRRLVHRRRIISEAIRHATLRHPARHTIGISSSGDHVHRGSC